MLEVEALWVNEDREVLEELVTQLDHQVEIVH